MYKCSRCGGTMSIPYDRCPHCGVLLSGVRCDNCSYVGAKSEFASNGHRCPKCGSMVSGTGGGTGDGASLIGCLIVAAIAVAVIYFANQIIKSRELREKIELSTFTDPKSGESSFTIKISGQEWMTENLNVSHFRNGHVIKEAKSEQEWIKAGGAGYPAWCQYANDSAGSNISGKLYNWYACSDQRGICPEGWQVSTSADWEQLITNIGGYKKAGKILKSNKGWASHGKGNNKSHFAGFPVGKRNGQNGLFSSHDSIASWWTTDVVYKDPPLDYGISYFTTMYGPEMIKGEEHKGNGLSVRCVRYDN